MLKYFWSIMSKSVSVGRVSLLVWLPSRREKACLFFMTRLCAFGREGEPFLYRDRKPARGVVHPQKSEYVRKGNVYKKRSTTHRGCESRKESQPTTVNTAGAVWRCHSGKKPLVIPRLRSSRGNPSPNEVADCHAPFIFVQGARNDLLN